MAQVSGEQLAATFHGHTVTVAYTTIEGREELLERLAEAIDEIAIALANLGEAYEQLDEYASERLEQELFRPVQGAYGRAKRTHAEFAERYGLATRTFPPRSAGAPAGGVKGLIERALDAAGRADGRLGELQDSMLPVEVGDPQVRAEITQVREHLGGLRARARQILRVLGR
jgi:hypothetical protein